MMPAEAIPAAGAAAPARQRVDFLDGLRGVAIVLVILFHAYARWPELVPYGDAYAGFALFRFGWLGVELFFLISGFVIFLTLEKTANFPDFMTRRWLRLFPAMLICSVLVFASAALFPERPAGAPHWRDLLPGLSFIEPWWWQVALRSPQHVLEGAFWSLFVEVRFYAIAGCLYFWIGRDRTIAAIAALFAIAFGYRLLHAACPALDLRWLKLYADVTTAQYFGWFAAGARYYEYFYHGRNSTLCRAIGWALLSALSTWYVDRGDTPGAVAASLAVVLLFTLAVTVRRVRSVLGWKPVLWLGLISYPLYLMHENALIACVIRLGRAAPWCPPLLLPVVPLAVLLPLAFWIARSGEPRVRAWLRPLYVRSRRLIQAVWRRLSPRAAAKEKWC